MIKYVLMLLYVFSISFSAIAQDKYIVTGKAVNIRQGANKYSTVIGSVHKNDTVIVYSFSGDWAEISTINGNGYINKKFIKTTEVISQSTESKSDYSWIGGLIIFILFVVVAFLIIRFIFRKIKQAFKNTVSVSTKTSKPIQNNTEVRKPETITPYKGKSFKLPSLNNLHTSDEAVIIDFLNTNSKAIGALKYIGSFIDEIKIKNEIGIKANLQFLLVEREEHQRERAGTDYEYNEKYVRDIFEYKYDLPDSFPLKQTEIEEYTIPSTIETHSCNPEERCYSCSGSGRCRSCDGSGSKSCSSCSGTGKKEKRDGNYANGKPKYKKVACNSCDGRGRKSCSSCNGTAKCKRCSGSGQVTCSRCDGTTNYQTYIAFTSFFKPINVNFHFSEHEELNNIIPTTKNKIAFDDDIIEWENKSSVLFDNTEGAIKANKHSKQFINSLEKLSGLTSNQKFGRIHATVETIPITIVDYSFEGKEFQLSIVGEENIVCFQEIPRKHGYKVNISKRIMNTFTKKNRQISFVYIASYMFNSDGSMDEPELKLLDLFLNNIKLKQEEKNVLVGNLKQQITVEELAPKIKNIKGDLRALVFAWQCVMQDGQINQTEIEAFMQLSKLFKVNEDELEKIKHKATKFAQLKDSEMLEEYFKA